MRAGHEFVLYGPAPLPDGLAARTRGAAADGARAGWQRRHGVGAADAAGGGVRDALDVFFAPAYTAPLRLPCPGRPDDPRPVLLCAPRVVRLAGRPAAARADAPGRPPRRGRADRHARFREGKSRRTWACRPIASRSSRSAPACPACLDGAGPRRTACSGHTGASRASCTSGPFSTAGACRTSSRPSPLVADRSQTPSWKLSARTARSRPRISARCAGVRRGDRDPDPIRSTCRMTDARGRVPTGVGVRLPVGVRRVRPAAARGARAGIPPVVLDTPVAREVCGAAAALRRAGRIAGPPRPLWSTCSANRLADGVLAARRASSAATRGPTRRAGRWRPSKPAGRTCPCVISRSSSSRSTPGRTRGLPRVARVARRHRVAAQHHGRRQCVDRRHASMR